MPHHQGFCTIPEAQRAVAELPWPAAGGHRRTFSLRKAWRTRRPHLSDHDITLANDRDAVKDYFPILAENFSKGPFGAILRP